MHFIIIYSNIYFQLWSSKWNIKDEHKLFSDLGSGGAGGSPYYDSSAGFPATTTSDIYDTISTMSQAQSTHIYNPPIGTSLGNYLLVVKLWIESNISD